MIAKKYKNLLKPF